MYASKAKYGFTDASESCNNFLLMMKAPPQEGFSSSRAI